MYASYSAILLWAVRRFPGLALRASVVMYGVDLGWASALTFFSEGPASPFFLFLLFVLLAAAYRWGFRETLATAGLTIGVFLLEIAVAAIGPWSHTWFADVGFTWTPVVMRTTYLLITGFLLAYLAEREKQFRAEMAATADAMRQPRVEIGTDGSVGAVASFVARAFGATTVDIVIQDHQDGRTSLWHAPRSGHDPSGTVIQTMELDELHRAAWLFGLPQSASLVTRTRDEDGFTAVTLTPETSVVRHVFVQPPPLFRDNHEFQSFMTVDFGLADQWRGRLQTLLRHEVIALRELMQELRPVDIDVPGGLPSVLSSLVARFHRDTGIETRFVSDVATDGLPLGTAVEIVRIVQEALVNVRKHSGARHAAVRLTNERRDWTVAVEDDGRGFAFEGRLTGAELEAQLEGPIVIRERARARPSPSRPRHARTGWDRGPFHHWRVADSYHCPDRRDSAICVGQSPSVGNPRHRAQGICHATVDLWHSPGHGWPHGHWRGGRGRPGPCDSSYGTLVPYGRHLRPMSSSGAVRYAQAA